MDPEHSYTLLLLPHMMFNCPSSARSQPQAWRSRVGFQLIQVALACPALALLLLLELRRVSGISGMSQSYHVHAERS